jgi:hypothetical protein
VQLFVAVEARMVPDVGCFVVVEQAGHATNVPSRTSSGDANRRIVVLAPGRRFAVNCRLRNVDAMSAFRFNNTDT